MGFDDSRSLSLELYNLPIVKFIKLAFSKRQVANGKLFSVASGINKPCHLQRKLRGRVIAFTPSEISIHDGGTYSVTCSIVINTSAQSTSSIDRLGTPSSGTMMSCTEFDASFDIVGLCECSKDTLQRESSRLVVRKDSLEGRVVIGAPITKWFGAMVSSRAQVVLVSCSDSGSKFRYPFMPSNWVLHAEDHSHCSSSCSNSNPGLTKYPASGHASSSSIEQELDHPFSKSEFLWSVGASEVVSALLGCLHRPETGLGGNKNPRRSENSRNVGASKVSAVASLLVLGRSGSGTATLVREAARRSHARCVISLTAATLYARSTDSGSSGKAGVGGSHNNASTPHAVVEEAYHCAAAFSASYIPPVPMDSIHVDYSCSATPAAAPHLRSIRSAPSARSTAPSPGGTCRAGRSGSSGLTVLLLEDLHLMVPRPNMRRVGRAVGGAALITEEDQLLGEAICKLLRRVSWTDLHSSSSRGTPCPVLVIATASDAGLVRGDVVELFQERLQVPDRLPMQHRRRVVRACWARLWEQQCAHLRQQVPQPQVNQDGDKGKAGIKDAQRRLEGGAMAKELESSRDEKAVSQLGAALKLTKEELQVAKDISNSTAGSKAGEDKSHSDDDKEEEGAAHKEHRELLSAALENLHGDLPLLTLVVEAEAVLRPLLRSRLLTRLSGQFETETEACSTSHPFEPSSKTETSPDARQQGWMPRQTASHASSALFGAALRPMGTDPLSAISGMKRAKKVLTETVLWPRRYPQVFERFGLVGGATAGLLLFGPPGTGKTLLPGAVASALGCGLVELRLGEVVRGEVGASEQRLIQRFQEARRAAPCVVFIDEFQALFTARTGLNTTGGERGGGGDDGGGDNGSLSAVLAGCFDELAAWNRHAGPEALVMVVAATNEPWAIDGALLRPGRLETCLLLGPLDAEGRCDLLQTQLLLPAARGLGLRFTGPSTASTLQEKSEGQTERQTEGQAVVQTEGWVEAEVGEEDDNRVDWCSKLLEFMTEQTEGYTGADLSLLAARSLDELLVTHDTQGQQGKPGVQTAAGANCTETGQILDHKAQSVAPARPHSTSSRDGDQVASHMLLESPDESIRTACRAFLRALARTPPSVSADEMDEYIEWQRER